MAEREFWERFKIVRFVPCSPWKVVLPMQESFTWLSERFRIAVFDNSVQSFFVLFSPSSTLFSMRPNRFPIVWKHPV